MLREIKTPVEPLWKMSIYVQILSIDFMSEDVKY